MRRRRRWDGFITIVLYFHYYYITVPIYTGVLLKICRSIYSFCFHTHLYNNNNNMMYIVRPSVRSYVYLCVCDCDDDAYCCTPTYGGEINAREQLNGGKKG